MSNNIKRRKFLRNALLTSGGVFLVPNFISCKEDDLIEDLLPDTIISDLTEKNFNQGVASFDPTNSQVIIWTRYNTSEASIKLIWQLATDESFETVVREGEVSTDPSRDYTVAIEVKDLEENQKLYYRFVNTEDLAKSPTGETLTFGETITQVKLAVASCSNHAAGYFNAYEAIKNSEADAVVHLGDYIYEYGPDTFGSFRNPNPAKEIISLDEYRTRYRQYREDEQLKELHRKKPFICVWDDHEITNDTHRTGAENHQEDEGDFEQRKADALQAYSEYLPNTTNITNNSVIYRNLRIGNLVDLIMLDTRIVGRDVQLDINDYITATGIDSESFTAALSDPTRTMLGATQKAWFMEQMNTASASWQIIGQQVLMGKMFIPIEMFIGFGTATAAGTAEAFLAFESTVAELVEIKLKVLNGIEITAIEQARISNVIPYNLDAWDGYAIEREQVLATFTGKNVAVLAGDTHNAWQNKLTTSTGDSVANEFATSSISSSGFERFLPTGVEDFESALEILIDGLQYMNASNRGYMMLTVTSGSITSDWNFIDTVEETSFNSFTGNSIAI